MLSRSTRALVNICLENDYLPVISSLGADDEGRIFNINADTIASEIAANLKAEKLILLSDVNGIYLDANERGHKAIAADGRRGPAYDRLAAGDRRNDPEARKPDFPARPRRQLGPHHERHERNAILAEVFTDEGTGTMVVK